VPHTRPTRIPLFPLDIVLLPGMSLPLHIFEPRYKLMVGVCLAENLEFGMILASDKGITTVGCTAAIIRKLKEYPDGRMDILTEGRTAFNMLELLNEKEYHEAVVEYPPEDDSLQDASKEKLLNEAFDQCLALLLGQSWAGIHKQGGTPLSYQMGAQLPLSLEQKQGLLEMRDEGTRRDLLLRWINELLPQLAHRQRTRKAVGGNGHALN
jgi:Lon protease-like protein